MSKKQISSNDYSIKKVHRLQILIQIHSNIETSRSSEIPEFIKNSQQQVSAR